MDKRGGGVPRFSVENFLSPSAEKFRRGGESFSIPLISFIEKVRIRGGGGYQDFPSKIFCLSAEKFRRTLYSFTNFGYRKFLFFRVYVTFFDFLSKIFCLKVPKKFVGEPFCAVFQKISGAEKVWIRGEGGLLRFRVEIFFVS